MFRDFKVTVRTPDGATHEFTETARASGDAADSVAARFGYLCYVFVGRA